MSVDRRLLAQYGLKYHPFNGDIPPSAIWSPPASELFISRVKMLSSHGGFAGLWGDVGLGKSKLLHLLSYRLEQIPDLKVGVMQRPQSTLSDFYRELGELFGVRLNPNNRYGGFKLLRQRWEEHIKGSLFRPVLLLDEAQQAAPQCLTELRLLTSELFDSRALLTVVLCGDLRLPERFRLQELLPLGSRISTRLSLEALPPDQAITYLTHLLEQAGAPTLMTPEVIRTLAQHSGGNPRLISQMGAELLAAASASERPQLDEKLFLEVFQLKPQPTRRSGRAT